jgi:hypothetical protein
VDEKTSSRAVPPRAASPTAATGLFSTSPVRAATFLWRKLTDPPTPRGGTWSVDVYRIDGVILYNMT